jgi:hypothetical protein
MKRKIIVLTFMLSFLGFISKEMQAQTDAYFSNTKELRSSESVGAGLGIEGFSGQFGHGFNFGSFDTQQGGFGFEDFTGGDAPVGNGLLLMTATGLIYLMNKRRKENE